MKITIIMLLVAGSFLWSLYKRFKRTLAETASDDMTENQPSSGHYDETVEESDLSSSPYFSYEYDIPADQKTETVKGTQRPSAPKPQPVMATERSMAFDIRQAVIYQTILNNPYLDEINQ